MNLRERIYQSDVIKKTDNINSISDFRESFKHLPLENQDRILDLFVKYGAKLYSKQLRNHREKEDAKL